MCLLALTWFTSYRIGEVFVLSSSDDTTAMLEQAKSTVNEEIGNINKKCDEHKQVLSDLKVQLYAKFGNNINLEADDEGESGWSDW